MEVGNDFEHWRFSRWKILPSRYPTHTQCHVTHRAKFKWWKISHKKKFAKATRQKEIDLHQHLNSFSHFHEIDTTSAAFFPSFSGRRPTSFEKLFCYAFASFLGISSSLCSEATRCEISIKTIIFFNHKKKQNFLHRKLLPFTIFLRDKMRKLRNAKVDGNFFLRCW